MKPEIVSVLIHIYHYLLRLYPAVFRSEFGGEMWTVFDAALTEAGQSGSRAIALVCLQEVADLPVSLSQAYLQSWQALKP